jgi:hypothetical protein
VKQFFGENSAVGASVDVSHRAKAIHCLISQADPCTALPAAQNSIRGADLVRSLPLRRRDKARRDVLPLTFGQAPSGVTAFNL